MLPAVYPCELEVTLIAGQPRRSAFPLYSELRDGAVPEKVYARCEAMMVWIDLADGKSRPLPDWMRAQLA